MPLLKGKSRAVIGKNIKELISSVDILPRLKNVGFWVQTAIAGKACLTSPSPMVDAPTILMF